MKKSLEDYLSYIDTEEEFTYFLRMNHYWDQVLFRKMIVFISAVINDYKDEAVIPKSIVFFFARDVDLIVGMTRNKIFLNTIPASCHEKEYLETVRQGQELLLNLKRAFFSGEMFDLSTLSYGEDYTA